MEESSSFPSAPSDLGRVIGGRYRLDERAGVGSFAEVYRATNLNTGGACAVKLLRREHISVGDIRTRFTRESKLLARIDHPNIVSVFDAGEDEGRLYLTMPFLRGESLRAVLGYHQQTPLPWSVGIALIRDLLRALVALHGERIVHRDLKPANAMVSTAATRDERTLVLIDLGLSTWLRDPSLEPSSRIGSPLYRAPERWRGERADVRSDIYSAGAILYEVLTATTPFFGDDLKRQHLHAEVMPPDVRAPRAMIPRPIAALVLRALAKDPDLRFPTAAAFLGELELALERIQFRLPPGYHVVPRAFVRFTASANTPAPDDPPRSDTPEALDAAPAPAEAPRAADEATPTVSPAPAVPPRRVARAAVLAITAVSSLALAFRLGAMDSTVAPQVVARAAQRPALTAARLDGGPVESPPIAPRPGPLEPPPRTSPPSDEPDRSSAAPVAVRSPGAQAATRRKSPRGATLTEDAVKAIVEGAAEELRACPDVPRGWIVLGVRVQDGRAALTSLGLDAPGACASAVTARLRLPGGTGDFKVSLRL